MRNNNNLKTTIFIAYIKTITSFELSINNILKKKLIYSTNINCILNIDVMQEITITNYLIKNSRSSKILILIKRSTNKINILQKLNNIQIKLEKKL